MSSSQAFAHVTSRAAAVDALVGRLRNLHDGPLVFREVVRLADAAVPALEHLVRGPADALHQVRSLGAGALAAIGTPAAVRALTRALLDSVGRDLPPVLLEAESILVNHVAEHLSLFPEREVTDALLIALRRRRYPYCAAALGLIGDPRAVPLLIDCLYEDACRPAGMGALRRLGRAALEPLTRALLAARPAGTPESPSRIDGRAACARLLGELAAADREELRVATSALALALSDKQRAVRVEAALALVQCGAPAAEDAAGILAMALDEENWARAEAIIAALVRIGAAAERVVVPMLALRPRTAADRRRRVRLVEAAGRLGSAAAVGCLRGFHRASDASLRMAAVVALDETPAADAGSLAVFLSDPEPAVRWRALQALRRRRAADPEATLQLLGDDDESVRKLADETVRESLDAALPALRRAACRCGAPLHGLVPRLRLWWRACVLIAQAGRSPRPLSRRAIS